MDRIDTLLLLKKIVLASALSMILMLPMASAAGEIWDFNSAWNQGSFSNTTTATGNITLDVTGTGTDVIASNYADPCQRGNECRTNQGDYIDAIWFTAVSRGSGDNNGYLDATNSISSPLVPGKAYNLTVRAHADTSGPEQEYVNVSFDWDQNQDISNDYTNGPAIGSCYTGSPTCNVSSQIVVPESAARGSTLMRVIQEWNQWPSSFTNGPRYGEVEDYSVFVGDYVPSGTYTTEWRDTGRNASWYWLNYTAHNTAAGRSIDVVIEVSDDGINPRPETVEQSLSGSGGINISSLPNSRYIRITAGLTSSSAAESPRIDLLNASHKLINTTTVNITDYPTRHEYNATGVAEAPSPVNDCEVYYKRSDSIGSYNTLNDSYTVSGSPGTGQYSCSGVINSSLPNIGNNTRVNFYFRFIDEDGVTKTTSVTSHRVPNTPPSINFMRHEAYTGAHAFNFSAVGYDPDVGENEIASCTIYARDQQGNQYSSSGQLGTQFSTFPNSDHAHCNATISSNLGSFEVGETIDVWADFTDTSGATTTSSIESRLIPNHAPEKASGPFFTDQASAHGFNISGYAADPDNATDFQSCTIVVSDRDGNTYNLNGDVNRSFGNENQASCNYSAVDTSLGGFEVNEIIDSYIRFNDRYGENTETGIKSRSIPNRAPEPPMGPSFTDSGIDRDHVLDHSPMINWTNPSDPEGDSYTIRIYTESSPNPSTLDDEVSGVNNTTIGNDVNLVDGESYNVTLEACDAWTCSNRSALLNFTMNAKPSISDVTLRPSNPQPQDRVNISVNITDPHDPITSARFTIWNQTDDDVLSLDKEGFQNGTVWYSDNFTVLAGTTYNWTVNTTDGFEYAALSGSFETGNAPPSIVSGPHFEDYIDSHRFNVSAVASDANTDLSNYTIHLDDGDGNVYSFTRDVVQESGSTYYANFSAVDMNLSGFQVGESIDVWIVFRDDAFSTATTPTRSHEIPNRPPTIEMLQAKPADPFTNETLNVSYTLSDPEGDAIPTRLYRWYENGSATSITSRTVGSGTTVEYTNWSVEFQVRDEYGEYSTTNFSDNITILNKPPIIESIDYRNSSTEHLFYVNATARDIDGDDDVTSCTISYGSDSKTESIVYSYGDQNQVLCEGNISAGDGTPGLEPYGSVEFYINFSDESSAKTNNLTNVVPNREPSINLLGPVDGVNVSSSGVTFDWSGSDVEDDSLVFNLSVYNSTGLVHNESITQDSATVTLPDGELEWNVTVSDKYSGTFLSSTDSGTRSFTLDAAPPENLVNRTEIPGSSRLFPTEDQDVKIVTRWNDTHLDAVTIYENQTDTNHSVAVVDGWANYTITADQLEAGTVKYTAYAFDSFNNTNSVSGTFNVSDTTPPNITGFVYSPSTSAGLDPNKTIYVNATVSDNLKVSSMKLQYRQSGEGWKQNNLTFESGQLNASFEPANTSTYEFRVWANDTYNNTAVASAVEEIDFENTWTRTPSDIGDLSSTLTNNHADFDSIVVENTGDNNLTYDLTVDKSDSNLQVSMNTTSFSLAPGETEVIDVNASLADTSSDSEGLYQFDVVLNATNDTAEPALLRSEGTATFTLDAPYLEIDEDVKFPNSITQGETDTIPVEVFNIGGDVANDTRVTFELPSDWNIQSPEVQSIGDIPVGSSNISSIQVTVSENASTGTQVINISAEAQNRNTVFNASFGVDVIENSTGTTSTEEETVFVGGGGEETGPRLSEGESDKLLNTSSRFEIVRGDDQNFTITFENPTRFNLTNISISATGFNSQYLGLGTESIRKMRVNESRNITVSINAPEYFSAGTYNLNFSITGTGVDPDVFYGRYFNFTLHKIVELRVHAISRDEAKDLLDQMRGFQAEMMEKDLRTRGIERLVEDANESFSQRDYAGVQENFEESQQLHSQALETQEGLNDLALQIETARQQGLTVNNADRMANLAEAALDRGDYDTALNRLEEAQNIYALQTKGQVNWLYLIMSNWKQILAGIIIASILSVIGYYRYLLYRINSRLEALNSREQAISGMKKEDQRATFERREMSLDEYEDAVADYNQEMIEIVEERAELESRKANITNWREEASLDQQRDILKEEIQKTQKQYVEGEIGDTEIYETKVEELTKQLSTVEGDLAEIEADKNSANSFIGKIERFIT